jgi:hypothetical protein
MVKLTTCAILSCTQHGIHDRAYGRVIGDVHIFTFFRDRWIFSFTRSLTWQHGQEPFIAFVHYALLHPFVKVCTM